MEPSREDQLAALYRDFPHLPKGWVDMTFDTLKKMSPEEIEEMKRKVEACELPPVQRDSAGEMVAVKILSE